MGVSMAQEFVTTPGAGHVKCAGLTAGDERVDCGTMDTVGSFADSALRLVGHAAPVAGRILGMSEGLFYCVLSVGGAGLMAVVIMWIQERRSRARDIRMIRANAELLSRATGHAVYLDGIPEAEDPKLKYLAARGLVAMRKWNWDKGLRLFEKALVHAGSTKSAVGLYNLIGLCNERLYRWDDALRRNEGQSPYFRAMSRRNQL
jgi:hypothetical protein